MNNKRLISDIIAFIIVCIVLFFCFKFAYKKTNEINDFFNAEEAKRDLAKIEKLNNELKYRIAAKEMKEAILLKKIDSLQTIKPKIIIKYVQIDNRIDNEYCAELNDEFKRIFAANNFK